jgi:hypothetical protein
MRFTIRDLMWATIVVALWLMLLTQFGRLTEANRRTDAVRRHAEALRVELSHAEGNEQAYLGKLADVYGTERAELDGELIDVDWTLADQGIP